jgi:hypothetical protein
VAHTETCTTASSLRSGRRLLLSVLPMATGVALVTLTVARISMPVGAAVVVAVGLGARRRAVRDLDELARARLGQLTRCAIGAGVVATLAYDGTRFGTVALAGWDIEPFYAIPRFGQQFVGTSGPAGLQWAVGLTYHLLNGIGFAVAYAVVIRRPSWSSAIAWALVLEAAMVLLYPQWLGINITKEFTMVSLGGHLAWGTGLYATLHMTERRVARAQ